MAKLNTVDYKKKYQELRAKFVSAMDTAFRMGFQQGQQQAAMESAQQQAAQAQQMAMQGQQMAMQGDQMAAPQDPSQQETPGVEQTPGMDLGSGAPTQDGGELDSYISELESIVNKAEGQLKNDLKKSLEKIKTNKTMRTMSSSFKVNLPNEAKKAITMQEKIVSDILNKWEKESQSAISEMANKLGVEALTKKEE